MGSQSRGKGGEKARGVRVRAEDAFLLALGKLTAELDTLWEARELARTDKGQALSDVQEYRLWWLAERIIGATKGVIPISAEVSSTVDIPIIPLGVVQLLRGIVPGREALAEIEAGKAEAVEADEVPAVPLSAGRATRQEISDRNKAKWRDARAKERRERRESRERREQGAGESP